ncbi:hypothetical protein [Nioella sp.]|uniref:hypothetical protein n=1 Tax=Nioella sp. TaxID=1912091 RepID=UPI0035151960
MTETLWRALETCARHGRLVLVAGLVAGISLPDLAQAMRPHLPWMVAVLLFFSAFRIGPAETIGQMTRLWRPLRDVALLQLLLPVAGFALFSAIGVIGTIPALAVMLMLSAPSITGAPNFVVLAGKDPAPAMQILIFGTALFPLTVLPVLWLMQDAMPGAGDVLAAAGRLVAVVALAVVLGFAARALILPRPDAGQTRRLDGIGVILLALIVIGLMAGVAPLIDTGWRAVGFWLAVVFAANFGLQLAVFLALRARTSHQVALSIIAGNRNVALFLVALPATTVDALLPFIACYQFPMYLTPLLLGWLHTRSET